MKISKNKIIKPPRLRKGDTIGIVAPASSFDINNFKEGIKVLRKIGYKVKYERSIFNECWSKPGHDKQRGVQINRMFADTQVKAIFCAKAGYGSIETLPFLDKEIIQKNPKIFVGYSDITTLLLNLQKIANMVVFHGPVVSDEIHEDTHPETLKYLLGLISDPVASTEFNYLKLICLKPGKATGVLVGGNMSLIVDALKTPYDIETAKRILFLEDVGEEPNVIKNYLYALKEKGKFKKIKGLLLGKMTGCFQKQETINNIINEVLPNFKIPIVFGFPSGHISQREDLHITLPLGVSVTVDANDLTIKINEAAVE